MIDVDASYELITLSTNDMPSFVGYDEIINAIRAETETVRSGSDVYADRKSLTKLRSSANHLVGEMKKRVKEYESSLVYDARMQIVMIAAEVDCLLVAIDERVKEIDAAFQRLRIADAQEIYDRSVLYYPFKHDITFDDIMNTRWVNRSVSEKMIREEIDQRLESLSILAEKYGISDALESLQKTGWSLARAIRRLEPIDVSTKEIEYTTVNVTLPKVDLSVLKDIVNKYDWRFV